MQVSLQILILLLASTKTATTGGLETIFNQSAFGLDATTILILSISWSLKTSIMMHLKTVKAEKEFCPTTSKIFIFAWGLIASLRRVLSIVCVFIPSMGLFSMLYHHAAEKIPFRVRLDYAKKYNITPEDKISLYGLNETIFWTELDRWEYSDPHNPTPPHYSIYTMMTLADTFKAFIAISALNFLMILIVKMLTSPEFRTRGHLTNKFVHVLQNTNYGFPYKDWDDGKHTVEEFRLKYKTVCKEMAYTLATNIVFSLVMMVPLWYTGTYK